MPFTQIGSMKFHFLAGTTAPTSPAVATEYLVKWPEGVGGITSSVDTIDHEQPTAGVLVVDRSVVTKAAMEYSYTVSTLDNNVLSFLLGGATPTTNTPPSTIAVGTDFAHTGYGYMEWYDNGDVSGTPARKHYGFTCQIVPDGDFSLDPKKFSEAKFKIKITANRGTFA